MKTRQKLAFLDLAGMPSYPRLDPAQLREYLTRIGFLSASTHMHALPAPTLETLADLSLRHLQTIPFENFGVLLTRNISMKIDAVFSKLVEGLRGGYCFEQNTLLLAALGSLGFDVYPMLCRVRWMKTPDAQTPYTHLVLVIRFEGGKQHYLVDVGFGGIGSLVPLPIIADAAGAETRCADGTYRFVTRRLSSDGSQDDLYTVLQWKAPDFTEYRDLYMFRSHLSPALDMDVEGANWWSCCHPSARWVNCLFTSIVTKSLQRVHVQNMDY